MQLLSISARARHLSTALPLRGHYSTFEELPLRAQDDSNSRLSEQVHARLPQAVPATSAGDPPQLLDTQTWSNTTQHQRHAIYPRFLQCVLHGARLGVPLDGTAAVVPCKSLLAHGTQWHRSFMKASGMYLALDDCRPLLTHNIGLPQQSPLVGWAQQRLVELRPQTSDWHVFKAVRVLVLLCAHLQKT